MISESSSQPLWGDNRPKFNKIEADAREKLQDPPALSSKEASGQEEANLRDDGKYSLSSIEVLAFIPGVVDYCQFRYTQ